VAQAGPRALGHDRPFFDFEADELALVSVHRYKAIRGEAVGGRQGEENQFTGLLA
jgi:hypothetical protein